MIKSIINLLDPLQSAISLLSWEDAEDIAREISRMCRLKRLDPLQSAISLLSWEDAEDIAREISRMCRLKRLEGLQAIQEALALTKEAKMAPGGSQVAKQGTGGRNQESETVWVPISQADVKTTISATELLGNLADPAWCDKAKKMGWSLEDLKKVAESALSGKPEELSEPPAFRPEPGITLETRFDEFGHSEQWRNEVAKELNLLLCNCDLLYERAFLSIATRVAQFEEIQVKL